MKMRQKNRLSQKSEQDLWREEAEMMHLFRQNRESNLLTLISLFKGHYLELTGSILFFILKHSPTWVLPVVTANIINAVTDHNGNITRILLLNTVIMIVFFVQNIPTNYIHTGCMRKPSAQLKGNCGKHWFVNYSSYPLHIIKKCSQEGCSQRLCEMWNKFRIWLLRFSFRY